MSPRGFLILLFYILWACCALNVYFGKLTLYKNSLKRTGLISTIDDHQLQIRKYILASTY